ncbi:transcriptional regulator [Candidatus Pacearchaeota archaeon]|nr:transcriptional regulator [Candidatus Pacearchaeota archaeon]
MEKLTEKQQILLDEIKLFIKKNGYSPTCRELMKKVGLRSTSSVHRMLKFIKSKGHISMEPNKSRTIKIIEEE